MISTTLAISLAGNFDAPIAIGAGLVGAVAMLAVIYMSRTMGMTTMDLLKTLGTMVVPKASDGTVRAVGMMVHLMMGAAYGLVHIGLPHLVFALVTGAIYVGAVG